MDIVHQNKDRMAKSDFDNAKTEIIDMSPPSFPKENTGSYNFNKFPDEHSEREIVNGVAVLEELQVRGNQYVNQFGDTPESIHLTVVLKNILYTNYAFFEEMQLKKKIPEGLTAVFVMGDLQRFADQHLKVHVYFLDEADYKVWRANNLSLGRVIKEVKSKKQKMIGI